MRDGDGHCVEYLSAPVYVLVHRLDSLRSGAAGLMKRNAFRSLCNRNKPDPKLVLGKIALGFCGSGHHSLSPELG